MVISWGFDESLMMGECMGINMGFMGISWWFNWVVI
jgi:hypothetical protein